MNCKRPLEAVRRLEVAQKRLGCRSAACRRFGGLLGWAGGGGF